MCISSKLFKKTVLANNYADNLNIYKFLQYGLLTHPNISKFAFSFHHVVNVATWALCPCSQQLCQHHVCVVNVNVVDVCI